MRRVCEDLNRKDAECMERIKRGEVEPYLDMDKWRAVYRLPSGQKYERGLTDKEFDEIVRMWTEPVTI